MDKPRTDITWQQKTLEVLENDFWPEEKDYPSDLIKRCYDYRKIPVKQLTIGQLRTLISQKIGIKYLIPLAIEFLNSEILAEDLYPGDLLEVVLATENSFWNKNQKLKEQIIELVERNRTELIEEGINLDILDTL